jgi:hypothetical protein
MKKSTLLASTAAITSLISVGAFSNTPNRPATSAVTANTCLEKLASGASKQRCENLAPKRKSRSQEKSDVPGTNRASFLNPRSPGTGVATTSFAVSSAGKIATGAVVK